MKSYALIMFSFLLAALSSADTKVYQSIDEEGNIYFSNIPTPNIENDEFSINETNTYAATSAEQSQHPQGSGNDGQQKTRQPMQQGNNARDANSQAQDTMPPPPPMIEE